MIINKIDSKNNILTGILKIMLMLILGIAINIGFTTLAMADENGQEYEFYNAAKENAIEYAELGIITPEPLGNIAKTEKQNNNKTEYLFSIPDAIYGIKIRNSTIPQEEIRVETLKDISKLTSSIPVGDIYINENIWLDPDIEIYVDFKVKNSWLYGTDYIQLFKWTGDKWKKLKPRIIGKDNSYTYFEEGLAGSSILSITGNKLQTKQNQENHGPLASLSIGSLSIGSIVIIFIGSVLVLYIVFGTRSNKRMKKG